MIFFFVSLSSIITIDIRRNFRSSPVPFIRTEKETDKQRIKEMGKQKKGNERK